MNPASAKLVSDTRWSHVKFLVKANENEQFFLWKEHAKTGEDTKGLEWKTLGESKPLVIDHIDGKPIALLLTFVKLEDVVVAFYDCNSRLVDWDIVTSFLKEVFKGKWQGDKNAVCNYSTFKDCVKYVLNEKSRAVDTEKEKG